MAIWNDDNNHIITKLRMRDAMLIFVGTTLVSLAVQYVFDPAGMVTGGVSGMAIVCKKITEAVYPGGVPLWFWNVVLNIPVFLFAIYAEGFRSTIRTGLSWVIMSAELAVLPACPDWLRTDNLLLTAAYGGILFGVGTGILLQAHATSGGTDMLGKSLHVYFPYISMGRLIQILDGIVVVLGAITFDLEHTLFAIISVYVTGRLTDKVLDQGKKAKIALIISPKNNEIAQDVLFELNRGVTAMQGTGMYSHHEKNVLICVCSMRDLPDLKKIVKQYDKRAFFVVGTISEAMGEGFVEKWS